MIKRILSFILIFTFLVTMFISCGNKTPNNANETTSNKSNNNDEENDTENVENTVMRDNLPSMDFGGTKFRILSYETVNCNGIHVVEEQSGEPVNDKTYEVIRNIEERFNVEFTEYLDSALTNTGIRNSILAGDDAYELVLPNDLNSFAFVQNNLALNYSLLPYIDLSQPYWDQSLNNHISINNQYYYALGGIDFSHLDYTHVMIFSKRMIENYSLSDPYAIVKEGKWTIDKMREYMKVVSSNLDFKTHEDSDIYGYAATAKQVLANFWMSSGEFSIAKDENDQPYFAVMDNEKFGNIVGKMFEILWDDGYWYYTTSNDNTVPGIANLIESDRVLFSDSTFHYVKTLRTVDADFGLLPYPKWDENQDVYYSRVEGGTRFPIVPITVTDLEFVSIIMEALACESMNTLLPAYYEVGLKGKVTRDEDSSDMIDLIYNTRVYDMGDTIWCTDIRDGKFNELFKTNNRDLASTAAALDTVMAAKLAEASEVY